MIQRGEICWFRFSAPDKKRPVLVTVAPMRRYVAGIGIFTIALAAPARAEPIRLEQSIAPACAEVARELGTRIERSLGGSWPSELAAGVTVEASVGGYRATVTLRDDERTRGTTSIDAPTCEEVVDAVAVVLTLALGEVARPVATEPESPSPAPKPVAAVKPSLGSSSNRSALRDGERVPADRVPSDSVRATRMAFATGVDRGTLPRPTLTLAGTVARSFGGLELEAVARYGLPVADEVVEAGFSESQRHDFGGLELRACRGLGQAVRVSACAGTEVGAVRKRRAVQEGDVDLDADHVAPRFAGTVATLLAYRGGLIEPGVEVAGAGVAFGRAAGAPWLSVRVAAGAAIAF